MSFVMTLLGYGRISGRLAEAPYIPYDVSQNLILQVEITDS
jgi:hypothetical protein